MRFLYVFLVHRLTASLALFLHLSPYWTTQLSSFVEVLGVKDILGEKLKDGSVKKEEVRRLVREVAQMCSGN